MDRFIQVIEWCESNTGNMFKSPRSKGKVPPYPFKIYSVDYYKQEVNIDFVGGKTNALPLNFWMFEAAIKRLSTHNNEIVAVGAKPQPPYIPGSVEEAIWDKAPEGISNYKVSSHICDILAASGFAEYGKTINPLSARRVQAVRLLKTRQNPQEPLVFSDQDNQEPVNQISKKEKYQRKYGQIIINWVNENLQELIQARLDYSWNDKNTLECVKIRNEISRSIILSRIKNTGGLDLDTLNEVTRWGFNRDFPLKNKKKALEITRKSFSYLDKGDLVRAVKTLMLIKYVGISRTSKIIGLFDQYNLCIYDSRVGTALKNLTHNGKKLIPIPAGYGREYDTESSYSAWAENYEKLIWMIEIMRMHLNENGHFFRSADIEMALFMMGK